MAESEKRFYRTVEIRESDIDKDKRTVKVAFSSEAPIERFDGLEILDHQPKSVRLGRLRNGAAVFVDHRGDQVGAVDQASIDADKRGGTTQCILCEHTTLEKNKVVVCVPAVEGGAPTRWVVMGPLTYFEGAVALYDLVKGLSQIGISDVPIKLH